LKLAAAGPLAGFSLGFVLLLLGFTLPPSDGLGLIIDPTVFHESFLVGGLGRHLITILKLIVTQGTIYECSLVLACTRLTLHEYIGLCVIFC
jgi:hypothetical protein